jgi:hypothetical protein
MGCAAQPMTEALSAAAKTKDEKRRRAMMFFPDVGLMKRYHDSNAYLKRGASKKVAAVEKVNYLTN